MIAKAKKKAAPRSPLFTFKCVDCGGKNSTRVPPSDHMLHCSKCGYTTVQIFHSVSKP